VNDATSVIAAGGVVWRSLADSRREVLLVHRPRYDDWSLPKGKLDPGEHVLAGAAREIHEETAIRVRLGPPVGLQRYEIRKNGGTVPKVVHYWSAVPVAEGNFTPNDEIDDLAWVEVEQARRQLSYPRDVDLLDLLDSVVPAVSTVVLVRHAAAVKRKAWDGKDRARPLSPEGTESADRLVGVLAALGTDRVLSSDAERCLATVLPYARQAGLTVEQHPEISERGFESDPSALDGLGTSIWAPGHVTVVCSHRPVLPALARELDLKARKFSPGAFLVAHRTAAGLVTERFTAP
jgi:8-oxo-dGTP pyrophosphatase MutT (NUDIX family)/phosphohistidine phosphatase SixA